MFSNKNKFGAMERFYILDECMFFIWVWKIKLNFYLYKFIGGKKL